MARLYLNRKSLPDVAEILRRQPGVLNARVVKDTLYLKSARLERFIEEAYHDAVDDAVDIISLRNRAPHGASSRSDTVVPTVDIVANTLAYRVRLPTYPTFSERWVKEKRKKGLGDVFWLHTGWFSNRFGKLLDYADMKQTHKKITSRLRGRNQFVKFDADIMLPTHISTIMQRMVISPFFNRTYRRPGRVTNTKGIATDVQLRAQYLESRRPLLGKIFQAHGHQMRIRLRKLIFTGKI